MKSRILLVLSHSYLQILRYMILNNINLDHFNIIRYREHYMCSKKGEECIIKRGQSMRF